MDKDLELLIEDISNIWDIERFLIPHKPVILSKINENLVLSDKKNLQSELIRSPRKKFKSLETFGNGMQEIVSICLEHEKQINPNWNDYFCNLTIQQDVVYPNLAQRGSVAHIDGMQDARYPKKFPVCHQYIVSSTLPTAYYIQSFDLSKFDVTFDWHVAFVDQAKEENIFHPKPFELVFQTAYCVHKGTEAKNYTPRTFIRVEFTLKD